MAIHILHQVRQAMSHLNPQEVREQVDRPFHIRLVAATESGYRSMEDFFLPGSFSEQRRAQALKFVHRADDSATPDGGELRIFEQGLRRDNGGVWFFPESPDRTVKEILELREDLSLALARQMPVFRAQVAEQTILKVAKENALFSLMTTLPNVVPAILLPWAVGEFASDTAFLTVNQVRMAFLLAAASDREVGYRERRREIGSIVASAFGWRALARELTGKIPMGGGVIPKAAIAFAGTYAVGKSLERFYSIGFGYTRQERREAYEDAFERGKQVAASLLETFRRRETSPG